MTGDGAPRAIFVRGTASVTLAYPFPIEDWDFSGMTVGGGEVFYADNTNKAVMHTRRCVYKTTPVPTTWSGFASTTAYQQAFGWDALLQFAQGSGTAITAIDFSTDGTHFTNFLTQASGALPAGFDQVLLLPAGGWLKLTFTGTQPTINVVPFNY